jgi:hypothetical protein
MPIFPSVEWFDAVRAAFNSDDSYRGGGGGTCDATVGIKAGQQVFLLVFDGLSAPRPGRLMKTSLRGQTSISI